MKQAAATVSRDEQNDKVEIRAGYQRMIVSASTARAIMVALKKEFE